MSSRKPESPSEASERLLAALRLLVEEVEERLDRHPWGHLLSRRGEKLSLRLNLPTARPEDHLGALVEEASRELDGALHAVLSHQASFRPGRVLCLRCGTAECDHASPSDPRQVFAGYSSTGTPRFTDLGQLLLELRDPQVDRLYARPPGLVARVMAGSEVSLDLLPAYRDRQAGYRIHGQVVVGWYQLPDPTGRDQPLALSFQVASTRSRRSRRRFGLNILGVGPDGETLNELCDRLGSIPWSTTVDWAQEVLQHIERSQGSRRGPSPVGERLDGLLQGIARRLVKDRRSTERKTRHARKRQEQGDRPTHMALPDLTRASLDNVYVDERRQTLVVLGNRGRAHVFNGEGKLVTSLRTHPGAVARRQRRDQWRPARAEELDSLRSRVAAHSDESVQAGETAPGSDAISPPT